MPLIVFLSYKAGNYWMRNTVTGNTKTTIINSYNRLEQYLFGSITLAIIAGIATGLITLLFLKLMKALKQYRLTAA